MLQIPAGLIQRLHLLDTEMLNIENKYEKTLREVHPLNRNSALNLLKYLYFRSKDQRDLQETLHDCGLSSLASSESHIHRQLQEILMRLGENSGFSELDRQKGTYAIRKNSDGLFGERSDIQYPSIMVTYETGFASDPDAIRNLILAGMQVARINCAHDNQDIWLSMIKHTREQSAILGTKVRIYMDMAGPKIRTVIDSTGKKKDRIKLEEGEVLSLLNREPKAEHAIGCSLKGIIPYLKKGQKVYFDDGKVEAKVVSINGEDAAILIERITGKPRLKSRKGINFPDASLPVQSLSDYDIECLPFISTHSDMLGYSFVRTAGDIQNMRKELKDRNLEHIPFVLKIETAEAVKNLPALLIESMKDRFSGVMIARGDLALEIGFERLSEIQEEITWICEAAHIPVIWATQVLESLNKSGLATRSEATDASMAGLADCVMINKGKNINLVLESLLNILKRSTSHRSKKRYIFRTLSIAKGFFQNSDHE